MENKELFQRMCEKANELESNYKALGGTGLHIGKRLALEGCNVLMAGDTSNEFIKMLPKGMSPVGNIVPVDEMRER